MVLWCKKQDCTVALLFWQKLTWHQKGFPKVSLTLTDKWHISLNCNILQYFLLHLMVCLEWLICTVCFSWCFSGGRLKWRILLKVLWTLWKPCLLGRGGWCPLHFTSRYATPFMFLMVCLEERWKWGGVEYKGFCTQVCSLKEWQLCYQDRAGW